MNGWENEIFFFSFLAQQLELD